MIGDIADIRQRLRLTLPVGWFADKAPILDGILSGFASAWTTLHELLQYVISQTRIKTATGDFLALAAQDYLSSPFPRRPNEDDGDYRGRLLEAMLRARATRPAIIAAAATAGYKLSIFEAAQPSDTGAYNIPVGLAWNTIGGWASLAMPFECLIVAHAIGDKFESDLWKNIADATPAGGVLWMRVSTTN